MNVEQIRRAAGDHGLVLRGGFNVVAGDAVPSAEGFGAARTLLLFGNAGSGLWSPFASSREYRDGQPDPLNRWSERVGATLAETSGGWTLFPFGGPPYQPFLAWAKKAESLDNSRLGMLIHPDYGLWHAYRFAIAFDRDLGPLPCAEPVSLCASCEDQPCLSGCPVTAFTTDGYDVQACYDWLRADDGSPCMSEGCQARRACPVGQEFRYRPAHARFHMRAFVDSLGGRLDEDTGPEPRNP